MKKRRLTYGLHVKATPARMTRLVAMDNAEPVISKIRRMLTKEALDEDIVIEVAATIATGYFRKLKNEHMCETRRRRERKRGKP